MTNLLILAFRYLMTRRVRTILTMLAIMFGVMVIFATGTLLPSIRETATSYLAQSAPSVVRFERISRDPFDAAQPIALVKNIEGVHKAMGVLHLSYAIPVPGVSKEEGPVVDIVGIEPTGADVTAYPIAEGRFLQPGDTRQVVIPSGLAEGFGVNVGAEFPLLIGGKIQPYTIIGLLEAGMVPQPQLFLPLTDLQEAFHLEGKVNALDISYETGANFQRVKSAVQTVLGDNFRVNDDWDLEAIVEGETAIYGIMSIFGIMALFVGGFIIFNTFRTAIAERQVDIALLRCIGAERGQIIRLMAVESLLLGVAGTALGILVASYTVIKWYPVWMENNNLRMTSLPLPATAYAIHIHPGTLLVTIVAGIGTSLLAGILPAYYAGRVSPLAALRPSFQMHSGRGTKVILTAGGVCLAIALVLLIIGEQTVLLGSLLVLIGAVLLAPGLIAPATQLFAPLVNRVFPQTGEIVRSSILRQQGRAAITVNTLMVGFAIFVASATIVASGLDYFKRVFSGNFVSDLILTPADNVLNLSRAVFNPASIVPKEIVQELETNPAVASMTGTRQGTTIYQGHEFLLTGIEPEAAAELRPIYFRPGEGDFTNSMKALGAGRALVLSRAAARDYNLETGDSIELETTAAGTQTYTVAGVADDVSIFIYGGVISQSNLEEDFGITNDIMVYINLQPGATVDELSPLLQNYPQLVLLDTEQYRNETIENSKLIGDLFYFLALIVVVPSLIGLGNTLSIGVMERTREFGLLRAVGGDRSQVRQVVLVEAMLLGAISMVIGIAVGLALSLSVTVLGRDFPGSFGGFYAVFPTAGIITALVGGSILTILVSLLPAQYASGLDIVQALRYE